MTHIFSIGFRSLAFFMFFLGLVLVMNRDATAADLKPLASVTGETIRMADIVEGHFDDPAMGDIVVSLAPAPGQRKVLSVQAISNLAYKKGVPLSNGASISRIVVERTGIMVPLADIQEQIENELYALGLDGRYQIRFSGRSVELFLPINAPTDFRVEAFQFDQQSHRFQARLIAGEQSGHMTNQQVFGTIVPIIEIPVLTRRLSKTDIIRESDIDLIATPTRRLSDGVATDVADLVGMSPRRTIQPGRPIRLRDVREPVVVAKGSIVTMVVIAPGLILTASGRSLEDGAMGSQVRIVNADTHQTISAEVVGPNQVRATIRRSFVTAELGQ